MARDRIFLAILAMALAASLPAQNSIYKSTPLPDGLVGIGLPFARMENGVILTHSSLSVTAFRQDATSPAALLRWTPGYGTGSIRDVSARPDHGTVTAILTGGGSENWTSSILSCDAAGRVESQFQTNRYAVDHIAVDGAGDIWTLGVDHDATQHQAGYHILREYTPDGRLLRSALPRSMFATPLEPAISVGGTVGITFLRVHSRNVAAYIAQTREWIEVGPEGQIVSRAKLQMPPDAGYGTNYPLSIAVTGSGSVFLQAAGFRLCKLDVRSGACPLADAPREVLLGASGDDLLFYNPSIPTHADWVRE